MSIVATFARGRKSCTDEMWALDVRILQRQRMLTPGNSLTWNWSLNGEKTATINLIVLHDCVTLKYRQRERGGEWRTMTYPVSLDWTSCNFGGRRAWWQCPAEGCGRRVAVLFGNAAFACRHCHRLAYRSQREDADDRATRRANKLRDQLGWKPGILNGMGSKPKRMHWATYLSLLERHFMFVAISMAGVTKKLGLRPGRHEDSEGKVS